MVISNATISCSGKLCHSRLEPVSSQGVVFWPIPDSLMVSCKTRCGGGCNPCAKQVSVLQLVTLDSAAVRLEVPLLEPEEASP